MSKRNSSKSDHEIFNLLLKQLYSGELKPGSKLPPLRTFAKELGCDSASLRIALKQLESMGLLDIKRSDGAYIKDFRETGGLDFFTRLFSTKENDSFVDPFLVDELLRFWIATFPEVMFMASQRYSSLDLKLFLEILDDQIEHVDDIDTLVELDVRFQQLIGKLANNLLATLFLNSLSPLTRKMTEVFYGTLQKDSRLQLLQVKKEGVCNLLNGTLDHRVSTENYRVAMEKCREEINKSIAKRMLNEK